MPIVIDNNRSSLLIPTIIGINILIFFVWNFSSDSMIAFMIENFLVSWDSLAAGRFWTLITSAFSHNIFLHIFFNMFVLLSFGSVVEQVIGPKRFLLFYLFAAAFSSFCHAFVSAYLLGEPEIPALGASGAVSGLILIFALMFPKEKIYIMGLVPIPALWGSLVFIGLDIWGLIEQTSGGGLPIGHGAHIGGALTGITYYFFYIKKRLRPVAGSFQ